MRHYPQLAILIPCYNEEECVLEAIKSACPFGQVFVLNNGSTDKTVQKAKTTSAIVLHESRSGYGNAVMMGMLEAKRLGKTIAIVLDADLSDNPHNIPVLMEPIIKGEKDFVLSSRTRKEDRGNLEIHQRLGNQLAVWLIKKSINYQYQDMGPFRAFDIQKILDLQMEDANFGWNIEMQMKAVHAELRIQEIELPYRKRLAGTSKVSGNLKSSLKAGRIILQSVFRYA